MPLSYNPQKTQAVLIGISEYPKSKGKLPKLPAVRNNINALNRIFNDPKILGIPSENAAYLIDEQSHPEIAIKIKHAAKSAQDLLFVYYAGHGLVGEDGNLYLAVGNTTVEDLELNALPFEKIRASFQDSTAKKKILILDCCYAGIAIQHGLSPGLPKLITKVDIEGTYALLAAPPNREAIAPPGKRYTAFTGLLIEALENGLDNESEVITLKALYEYIKKESKGWTRSYLTGESLEDLRTNGIPLEILDILAVFKNKEFKNQHELLDAVQEKIGTEQTDRYKELIRKHTKTLKMPEPEQLNYKNADAIAFAYNRPKVVAPSQPPGIPLSSRIFQHGLWGDIEQIAIRAVTSAGVTAMGFYRGAWYTSKNLERNQFNPSTEADLQSSITLLQTMDHLLAPLAKREKLDCQLFYLGEETMYKEEMEDQLQPEIRSRILPGDDFFKSSENSIRVIFDAIDGTANFLRGLPFFSSAVAILVEDQLRFAAVYDPIHNIVYSGVLKAGDRAPSSEAFASIWKVAGGERVPLNKIYEQKASEVLLKKAIGIHLTRNKKYIHELRDFLRHSTRFKITNATLEHLKIDRIDETVLQKLKSLVEREYESHRAIITDIKNTLHPVNGMELEQITSRVLEYSGASVPLISKVEQLATQFGGIYALNSGILAMVEVARGALGGFVNSNTNTWDVAAGEVLVRACGGKVTDFKGNPIQYSSTEKISVVAAKPEIHREIIDILINDR